MNILIKSSMFNDKQIKRIEKSYNATYVCETCIKSHDEWVNFPCAIFYTEKAHPEGSNYFAMYFNFDGDLTITNGITATEPFFGVQVDDTVIYSRYRHDYRTLGDVSVDGGRDYLKVCGNINAPQVKLQIIKDELKVIS